MKRQSKFFTNLNLKILFILIGITIGFASFTNCKAQAIVGKWNAVSNKQFLTAQGIKIFGKPVKETQIPTLGRGPAVTEFKSNHTYVTKSDLYTLTGTWSLSGDQLQLKMDAQQEDPEFNPPKGIPATISTISINGNTMIMDTNLPDNKIISKLKSTYVRN